MGPLAQIVAIRRWEALSIGGQGRSTLSSAGDEVAGHLVRHTPPRESHVRHDPMAIMIVASGQGKGKRPHVWSSIIMETDIWPLAQAWRGGQTVSAATFSKPEVET